jgi:hypothetical protein
MKNARFWTGLVFCAGLPMTLVMGTTTGSARFSVVEGSVTYNGRPVDEGLVLFQSQDRGRSPDIVAMIDRSGHFHGRAEWPLYPPGRVRFRLFVFPDPREPKGAHYAAEPGRESHGGSVESSPRNSAPPRELSVIEMAVLSRREILLPACVAGPTAPVVMTTAPTPSPWLPEIWLAPEPTRIDIDLKD